MREVPGLIDNPEVLTEELRVLLVKVAALEERLAAAGSEQQGNENVKRAICQKENRLDVVRHSIVELTDRMERPYVVSAELQAVKDVLDTLAKAGECNSIILEGEPGTGKTQWAYSVVGQELQEGGDPLLIHVRVKETMRAQDLLYSIDDVRRLSDAQAKAILPDKLRQESAEWQDRIMSGEVDVTEDKDYQRFKAKMIAVSELAETGKDLDYMQYIDLGPLGEAIYQSGLGKKVYFLIDEIEKGREELMTGLLDEIENLNFTIGETGTLVKGDKKNLRIIITTNTEDSDKIPSSFRRRSLYHYVDYPSRDDLSQIVELNFPAIQKKLLNYALSVFDTYHNHPDVEKKPSIPELLAWIRVLNEKFDGIIPDKIPYREVLLKYQEDQELEIGQINVDVAQSVEVGSGKLPHFVERASEGEPVYKVNADINIFDRQGDFAEYYAYLQYQGVNFVTPRFEEKEERDRYGSWEVEQKNVQEFQIIAPGVEYLGGGHYVVPDDTFDLFEKIVVAKTEVMPPGQTFTRVKEKNSNFTIGTFELEGSEYEGCMLPNGEMIVSMPYEK